MGYNRFTIIGNLTRDPELSYTPSNTAICKLGLASNRKFKRSDGEQGEETLFIDATAFGKQAEVLNQYLTKGRKVFIEGRIKLDQWTDKEGNKRSKHCVVVESFEFIDGQREEREPATTGATTRTPPADDGEAFDDSIPF